MKQQENTLKTHIPKGFRGRLLGQLFSGYKRWFALGIAATVLSIVTAYLTPLVVSFTVDLSLIHI